MNDHGKGNLNTVSKSTEAAKVLVTPSAWLACELRSDRANCDKWRATCPTSLYDEEALARPGVPGACLAAREHVGPVRQGGHVNNANNVQTRKRVWSCTGRSLGELLPVRPDESGGSVECVARAR